MSLHISSWSRARLKGAYSIVKILEAEVQPILKSLQESKKENPEFMKIVDKLNILKTKLTEKLDNLEVDITKDLIESSF